MIPASLLAVSGLVSFVVATPLQHWHQHHARDYVWVTETQEDIVTVPITQTIWLEPGQTPPAQEQTDQPLPSGQAPAAPPANNNNNNNGPPNNAPPSTYAAPSPTSSPAYVPPPPPPSPSSSPPENVAPPPPSSTSVYVAPTTEAAPSSAPAPPSPQASGPSSSSSGVSGMAAPGTSYTGDLTYYDPSVGLTACGTSQTNTDPVVALSHVIFQSYTNGDPNKNPLCGKTITITGKDGNPYTAKIVDSCPGCDEGSLDLTQAFFNTVTSNGDGRVHNMHWSFD